ncbi:MAG: hypothetical protein WCT49_04470 [Candidatus Paceibacterota bacterium]|jgi:hypothetical protein|nr:hypothetical protein [Candidatus Paceibacterota bacterium]
MRSSIRQSAFAFLFAAVLTAVFPAAVFSESGRIDPATLVPKVIASVSPRAGSFSENSTFEVPILLNTQGARVSRIELRINFDQDKLAIVRQSNGISIIGSWIETPRYDNAKGSASYIGTIPGGINTEAGLIVDITFRALRSGKARVSIDKSSAVFLADGLETEASLDRIDAEYVILRGEQEGTRVVSETHPDQNAWYNNPSPTLSWYASENSEGFNYVFDSKPDTIPSNTIKTKDTAVTFENVSDGLRYFHIKEKKGGIWSGVSHFLIRIDTVPPRRFEPEISSYLALAVFTERALISFHTADNLSGVDHYEVGVIDKDQPETELPAFMRSESPFLVPLKNGADLRVIVRAIDRAGNVRDASIGVRQTNIVSGYVKEHLTAILFGIIFFGFAAFIFHWLFSHRMLRRSQSHSEITLKEPAIPIPLKKDPV